jgi:hypothetical protein
MAPAARLQGEGRGGLVRWLALVVGAVLLGLLLFVAIPALQRLPGHAPAVQAIIDSEIEAGAFFYTDVQKVREAEAVVRGAGIGIAAAERRD